MEKEMEDKVKRVLIIGANSYVGKHLAGHLETKPDYAAELVRAADGQWKEKSFAGFDTVVLAAALVHRREKAEDEALYRNVNYLMPLEVARRAKAEGVGQMLFLSTMAVFGDGAVRIGKETKPDPTSMYGKFKLEAEKGIRKLEGEGFAVAIIRAPMVYGEGCPGNYASLRKAARYLRIFPDLDNKRSMVEVDELARQLEAIIRSGAEGFFYPQDPEYGNTKWMVKKIRDGMGKKTSFVKWFHFILLPLRGRVRMLHKLFGDCWYERE